MRAYFHIVIALLLCNGFPARAEDQTASDKENIELWCKHLSSELMSVDYGRCIKRKWVLDAYTSGRHPIPHFAWGREDSKQRILVLGAIHADEISAVSLTFRWLDFVDRQPDNSFVREYSFLFYPLINPDGFYVKPRTRTNSNGIDINRNFETRDWGGTAISYWKSRANSDPRRFPGRKAGGELETQVVQQAIETFRPQLIISVHAPYKVLDHDGPVTFTNELRSPLPVSRLGSFPGSLGTYAGIERNTPVITPELPSATTIPSLKVVEDLFTFILKSKF
jgi:protein MpaA